MRPYGESNVWWPVAGGLLGRLGLDRNSPAGRVPSARASPGWSRSTTSSPARPSTATWSRSSCTCSVTRRRSTRWRRPRRATPCSAGSPSPCGGAPRRTPVVLWIDDLQWAAPLLLDLLESIARHLVDLPVLILTTYRRDDDGITDWPQSVEPALTLHLPLSPLSESEVVELANTAAGRSLPDRTVQSISARAGGNPLFLTELARLAADSPDDPDGPELPGSLRVLDRGPARPARSHRNGRSSTTPRSSASRGGRRLRAFAGELGQPFDVADVDVLVEHGLMVRDGGRWQFRSDVVREVAYSTLTKQARAQRHAGTARYLAQLGDLMIDQRAHHLACAAELVGRDRAHARCAPRRRRPGGDAARAGCSRLVPAGRPSTRPRGDRARPRARTPTRPRCRRRCC